MLTSIKIGNFKAFAELQKIPIRPLTLIYGANSSGKSSILHSLIFARHAQETGELNVNCTEVGGEAVDLGGFRQYVHKRNSELRVQFEWEIGSKSFSRRLDDLLRGISNVSIGLDIGFSQSDPELMDSVGKMKPKDIVKYLIEESQKRGDDIEVTKLENYLETAEDKLTLEEVNKLKSQLGVQSLWLGFDSHKFLSMSRRPSGNLQVDTLDIEHQFVRYIINNICLAHSTTEKIKKKEIDILSKSINDLIPKLSFVPGNLFPKQLFHETRTGEELSKAQFVTVRPETRIDDLKRAVEYQFSTILEEIVIGIGQSIKNEIGKLTYLGPLRIYPPRHFGLNEQPHQNWVAGGGSAWEIARKNSKIRNKLNEWLGNDKKLSTAYELRIRHLLTIESIQSKYYDMVSRAMSILTEDPQDEDGVFKDIHGELELALDEIPDNLTKLESLYSDLQELVLYDKRTKTPVSHRDVGIGISQVLPVLATCFASKNKIIAMEQPEIHLHPALQAELGDVLIESAIGENKNTLLIESHSEHILLRIMRRMRETSNGQLPEGMLPITPKDVCVLYVEPDGSRSIVREMPLNENGELVKAWPGGFFEEGLREIF